MTYTQRRSVKVFRQTLILKRFTISELGEEALS